MTAQQRPECINGKLADLCGEVFDTQQFLVYLLNVIRCLLQSLLIVCKIPERLLHRLLTGGQFLPLKQQITLRRFEFRFRFGELLQFFFGLQRGILIQLLTIRQLLFRIGNQHFGAIQFALRFLPLFVKLLLFAVEFFLSGMIGFFILLCQQFHGSIRIAEIRIHTPGIICRLYGNCFRIAHNGRYEIFTVFVIYLDLHGIAGLNMIVMSKIVLKIDSILTTTFRL